MARALATLAGKASEITARSSPAMARQDVPELFQKLHARGAVSAQCLEFVILTAARSGEILHSIRDGQMHGMHWDEVDLGDATRTVSASRMKTGIEHRKPLSARAVKILREVEPLAKDGFVFASPTKRTVAVLSSRRSPFAALPGQTIHGPLLPQQFQRLGRRRQLALGRS